MIKIHQESKAHIEACRVQETWRANRLIDDALDSVAKTEETYWRRVLDRIVNVTLTLAQGNMPFRGHRENDTELQQVNRATFCQSYSCWQSMTNYLPN